MGMGKSTLREKVLMRQHLLKKILKGELFITSQDVVLK